MPMQKTGPYYDLCVMLEYALSERCYRMFELLCPDLEEATVLAAFKGDKAPHSSPLTVAQLSEKTGLSSDATKAHLEALLLKGVVANVAPDTWVFGPYALGCTEDVTDGIVYAIAMQHYDKEKDEITDPHLKELADACLEFVEQDWYRFQRTDELLHGRQLLIAGKKPNLVPNITALDKSGLVASDYPPEIANLYFLKNRASQAKTLAATACPCRFRCGKNTEFPLITCVFMDMGALESMTYRLDREIEVGNRVAQTLEEYIAVQEEGERKGMIHSSPVCLCEDDCCNEFYPLIKYASMKEGFIKSPFRAVLDENTADNCIGCGTCVKYCRFEALTLDGKTTSIDHSKCFGCGACVTMCPNDVHVLDFVG